MLNKKKITKLLGSEFRKLILGSVHWPLETKKIPAYARYVVDSQIAYRSKKFENDKAAYYGYNPIYPLCAILKNGTIDKRFFEFNIVNHFLKDKDGDSAVEVVKCILVEWCKENKDIKDFDINVIDAELARIEKEYLDKLNEEKKIDESVKQENLDVNSTEVKA